MSSDHSTVKCRDLYVINPSRHSKGIFFRESVWREETGGLDDGGGVSHASVVMSAALTLNVKLNE